MHEIAQKWYALRLYMDDDPHKNKDDQSSDLGDGQLLGLLIIYGVVFWLFMKWPGQVVLFFLLGSVIGGAIGVCFSQQRGLITGVLLGGALGPILWILGIMLAWPGV